MIEDFDPAEDEPIQLLDVPAGAVVAHAVRGNDAILTVDGETVVVVRGAAGSLDASHYLAHADRGATAFRY